MATKKASDEIFLEGAIRTTAAVGIENTRTKDIAEYAGFSEATLFRRFATKEALLQSAFLGIDAKISGLILESDFTAAAEQMPFELAVYGVWHRVYRYLVDNRAETVFLIRYRYSSLYTEEVRMQRQAYNGSFEKIYRIFEKQYGSSHYLHRGFLVNYIFELTLCLAEKIVSGRLEDTPVMERSAWAAIYSVIGLVTQAKEQHG